MDELNSEDAKLITLARGARGRIGASQGAAVRDEMGRTYAGATVVLPSLNLTSLEVAVAQAVAAGARGLECAVVLGGEEIDHACVSELGGAGVPILLCAADGSLQSRLES
ncbi:MAG: cytidine deaminase [Actinomycetota bacterium]|nr:cytidine deaminase [Actinomycetota bacterium]MDP2289491.1 cytidine deaminase [Actinomycetota bacterium]